MSTPFILIVAGHRSTGDGGDDTERQRTDELASAYTAAFRAAGYRASWLQRDLDGDGDPTMTIGNLTTVCLLSRDALAAAPENLAIMLDLHFDGAHSSVHAVVPDNVGLRTAFAGGAPADDTASVNVLDVQLAEAITRRIADATGLPLYGGGRIGPKGVFSERDTYVAGPVVGGYRLGMFAATAGQRKKAARLVIEHAGYRQSENTAAFARACADAAVAGVGAVLGERAPAPAPQPQPEPVAIDFYGRAFGAVESGGKRYAYDPRGPVSRTWREVGAERGRWPRLVDVWESDGLRWFLFSDGLAITTPKDGRPVTIRTEARG